MVNRDGIVETVLKLEHLIVDHCRHGSQSSALAPGQLACGQFFGEGARGQAQIGLHGIAAALRIAAVSSIPHAQSVRDGLVAFLCERLDFDQAYPFHDKPWADHNKTIKLSEVLHALSYVGSNVRCRDNLVIDISDHLLENIVEERGWDFFVEPARQVELLPTAYAVRALAAVRRCPEEVARQLAEAVINGSPAGVHDVVTAAVVYSLVRSDISHEVILYDRLREEVVPGLWDRLAPQLENRAEQALQYWTGEETAYVHIPYQIYLLGIAVEFSPLRRFTRLSAQRFLQGALRQVASGGFVYASSGSLPATRTNAILYDVLESVRAELNRRKGFRLFAWWDRFRAVVNSRTATVVANLVALVIVGIAVAKWYEVGWSFADLGPQFVGGIGMLILSMRNRR